MTSYACVDRIEGKYAVCEVELIPICESRPEDYRTKPTEMMDVLLADIPEYIGEIEEGDIIEVEHFQGTVFLVYCKNSEEKQRRIEV